MQQWQPSFFRIIFFAQNLAYILMRTNAWNIEYRSPDLSMKQQPTPDKNALDSSLQYFGYRFTIDNASRFVKNLLISIYFASI